MNYYKIFSILIILLSISSLNSYSMDYEEELNETTPILKKEKKGSDFCCLYSSDLEEVHPKYHGYSVKQVQSPGCCKDMCYCITCGEFGSTWQEMVTYDGKEMTRYDAKFMWDEEKRGEEEKWQVEQDKLYINSPSRNWTEQQEWLKIKQQQYKRNNEPKYCWGVIHWVAGITEYFQRCLCCGVEIDDLRKYSISDGHKTVTTTDCCFISMCEEMNYCHGLGDNPISGTLCCPFATISHCCMFPFEACCCQKTQQSGNNYDFQKKVQKYNITQRRIQDNINRIESQHRSSPSMGDYEPDMRGFPGTGSAERDAHHEAQRRQAQENQRRQQQEWDNYRRMQQLQAEQRAREAQQAMAKRR